MAVALGWLANSGVIEGVIIGATLAFLTAVLVTNAVARAVTTYSNPPVRLARERGPGAGHLRQGAPAGQLPPNDAFWSLTGQARPELAKQIRIAPLEVDLSPTGS